MADRVYLRHSTDKQTDARQRHALAALIAAGAPVYDDPATSSRRLSLDRTGFTKLLHEAAVGDTSRFADAARLFRSVADILALRPVLIRRGLRQDPGPPAPRRAQDHPPRPGRHRNMLAVLQWAITAAENLAGGQDGARELHCSAGSDRPLRRWAGET
ncbi:recombinase family protein [Spirillospora sp. CA-253888]